MRKVIGIGETILDIIFRDGRPYIAMPGGSVFNTLVSLSRVGVQTSFIGELGDDRVGRSILTFMEENGMATDYVDLFSEGLSSISLAFLSEGQDADYMFYSNCSKRRSNIMMPDIRPDDIVIFGSYYALNADTRDRVMDIVQYAKKQRAIVYYDPNFRKSHAHEAIQLRATVMTVIGDVLVVGTMERIGFTTADYAKRHHGGYLGSKSRRLSREEAKA